MTDIIKKKKYIIESSKNKKLYSISHEKQKNRKNLISDAALKAKMKEQPWWQRKELVKLETLSELD